MSQTPTPYDQLEGDSPLKRRLVSLAAFACGAAVIVGTVAVTHHQAPEAAPAAVTVAAPAQLTADQEARIAALHVAAREAADQFAATNAKDAALRTAATEAAQAYTGGNH